MTASVRPKVKAGAAGGTIAGALVLLAVSILGRNGVEVSPEEASALTVIVGQLAALGAGYLRRE